MIELLAQIDNSMPLDVDAQRIADNYATHNHPKVQHWWKRHPRFQMHFILTSSSRLKPVERWFCDLTQ